MAELSFFQQFVMDEIDGKNKAFDSYNAIIWKIRTGYLTLIFVGWGYILQGLLNNKEIAAGQLYFVIASMLFISAGLSIGGFFLDISYVLRKFRVIEGLNTLFTFLVDNPDMQKPDNEGQKNEIRYFIKVSGITGELGAVKGKFAKSVILSMTVYFVPLFILIYLYYNVLPPLAFSAGLVVVK